MLDTDIIEITEAAANQTPQIEIAYHTEASGKLFRLSSGEKRGISGHPSISITPRIKGLIRGYEIAWSIRIKPCGSKKEYVREFGSEPLSRLQIRPSIHDPDWAPYAVLLYSAFYDFSTQLIKQFGLTASPAPNTFSFANATGSRKNLEDESQFTYPPGFKSRKDPDQRKDFKKFIEAITKDNK